MNYVDKMIFKFMYQGLYGPLARGVGSMFEGSITTTSTSTGSMQVFKTTFVLNFNLGKIFYLRLLRVKSSISCFSAGKEAKGSGSCYFKLGCSNNIGVRSRCDLDHSLECEYF